MRINGRVVIAYSRTRAFIDRDAWEALPSDGLLLLRVWPRGTSSSWFALTRPELERTFDEVRKTRSWNSVRHYHFRVFPAALEAFRVCMTRDEAPFASQISAAEAGSESEKRGSPVSPSH